MEGFFMKRSFSITALLAALLAVSACSSAADRDEQRKNGNLTRTLDMVDKDGTRYGSVEMDPVGGGKVYDADGRTIGRIVNDRD
jgi:hypothetical protein